MRTVRSLGPRRVDAPRGAVHFDESRGMTACVAEDVAEDLIARGAAEVPPPEELCPGLWPVRRRAGLGDVLCLTATLRELLRLGGQPDLYTHPNYALLAQGLPRPWTEGGARHRPVVFDGWLERHPGRWGRPAAACYGDWWNLDVVDLRPAFPLTEGLRERGRVRLAEWTKAGPTVALFARAGWETRTYAHWRQVAHDLAKAGCHVLGFDGLVLPCCHSPAPMPLLDLAATVAACDLVVTGDSGPLHLAAALGVPAVAVFCCTSPSGVIGEGYDVTALAPEGLDCWPCWAASCRLGDLGVPGSCVRAIDPSQATSAALARLRAAAPQEPEDERLLRKGLVRPAGAQGD